MTSLRVLQFDPSNITGSFGLLIVGDVRDENNNPLNVNLPLATSTTNFFRESRLSKIGNINVPSSGSFDISFWYSPNLSEIGTIDASSATSLRFAFKNCTNLVTVGNITTTSALTNIERIADNCSKLQRLVISDCSQVTNTNLALLVTRSINELILTGLTVGIDASQNSLSATAINNFFTSLGTASGSQTVNVSLNPGSATCDTTIATAKGFTVIT